MSDDRSGLYEQLSAPDAVVIDGGIVTCIEGIRVWARLCEREVLLLVCYADLA